MLKTEITSLFNLNSFLKVKNDYFAIEQVLFSFVKTQNNKAVASIDCCITLGEALEFALSVIKDEIDLDMVDSDGYMWKSGIGGVHEEDAKRRGLRKDGLGVARWFGIQPADKGWARFTAVQQGGKTDSNGLIIPVNSDRTYISVLLPDKKKLRCMAMEILVGIMAYQSSCYTLEKLAAKDDVETAATVIPTAQEEPRSSVENVVCDGYYCIRKGSKMEYRGAKNDVPVLRMVVPVIFPDEPAILPTDDRWQLADVVFYENAVAKAGEDLAEQIREVLTKVEAGFTESLSIKGMCLKVGDIRDGYRQLVFTNSN